MVEVFYTTTGTEQPIFDKQTITSRQALLTGGTSIKYNSTMAAFNDNVAAVVIVTNRNFDYAGAISKRGIDTSAGFM
jgi:hypothetical protein